MVKNLYMDTYYTLLYLLLHTLLYYINIHTISVLLSVQGDHIAPSLIMQEVAFVWL